MNSCSQSPTTPDQKTSTQVEQNLEPIKAMYIAAKPALIRRTRTIKGL
jgi:hypothetical protein